MLSLLKHVDHAARPASVALSLFLLLGACAKGAPQADLGHACQLNPCACVSDELVLFQNSETTEILWRDTGEAYCPSGYHLERTSKKE